ncbi:MAG TPA: hypothetical protein VE053_13065 [Allosphingosinicella sp.]|nr:hypothetical protein [Allosphingosinicella sp.]
MAGKLNLRNSMGLAAALTFAGLLAPASANAQVIYLPGCIAYFEGQCAASWQAQGFASYSACVAFYTETACRGTVIYPDYSSASPSANRPD